MSWIVFFIVIAGICLLSFLEEKNNNKKTKKALEGKNEEINRLCNSLGSLEAHNETLLATLQELNAEKESVELKLTSEMEKNKKVISQRKSSEVRVGAIAENLVPLLTNLPYNPKELRHLATPIDYVYFDFDGADGPEIVFIEVKSGSARENKRQKTIKRAITSGKVFYDLVTINEKGIKVKRAEST